MIANLLFSLLLAFPVAPRVAHLDVVPIGGNPRLVATWSDGTVAFVEGPTDTLTTSWVDVNGLKRSIITDCRKAKTIDDCVKSHNRAVELFLQVAPTKDAPAAGEVTPHK